MPSIILKPREDLRIRRGHPWVYDNEIAKVEGNPEPGQEARVRDSRGAQLGYAFYNPASKIRARIYSRTEERADGKFFEAAFSAALDWRKRFFELESQSARMVFGEADSVPGLIVDRFVGRDEGTGKQGSWLSVQFLGLGVEARRTAILEALRNVFSPSGISERSDAPVRELEGLASASGVLAGNVPDSILIDEGGAIFSVDIKGGQKTGWYLDQRANRKAAARLAGGKTVLDVFCNQGGFGIACALAGAKSVLAVDSSAEALSAARKNAVLNGVADRMETLEANAFDSLRALEKEGRGFDMVILDPPAFAKNRASVPPAYRGYKEINVRALRLLGRGGILVTCSCSHWFDDARFDSMLGDAAFDCSRRLRLIEERTQDLDHPIVSGYEESRYLKVRILEAV